MHARVIDGMRSGVAALRLRRMAAGAGLLCLFWAATCGALSTQGTLRDLRHTGWGPKENAPDAIQVMVQTSDGYLWIGSAAGLFRFDGLHFEHINLPPDERVSSVNVLSLFAPASGGLWIGFNFGGAAFLKDGHLTAYVERDGLPRGGVTAFAQDLDGTMWASTQSGLARLDGSRWTSVGEQYHFSGVNERLLVDSAGVLWAVSRMRVLFLPRGEKIFRRSAVQPRITTPGPRDDAVGVAESPTGEVWLFCDQALQLLHKNDNPSRRTPTAGTGIVADRNGSLWIARVDARVQRIAYPENAVDPSWIPVGDPSDSYSEADGRTAGTGYGALLEDREGNVWVASQVGLDRFSERNVSRVLASSNALALSAAEAAIAAGEGAELWIGGRLFPLFRLRDGIAQREQTVGYVTSAVRADDGTVWFGDKTGLWRYTAGRFDRVALPDDHGAGDVQAIAQDRTGGLWVSIVGRGVYRRVGTTWAPYNGPDSRPAVTLSTDSTGRVWLGFTEGRMAMFDGKELTFFTGQNRLTVGTVLAIFGRRGQVWVGGDFGLALLEGNRFRAVTPDAGTTFNNITGIVETAGGDLWLNSSAGIVHLTADETRHAIAEPSYRVHGEAFDALEGVEGSPARIRPLPTAIEGMDGHLWFSTNRGVYAIDPAHIHRNFVPPQVMIQALTVDHKEYAVATEVTLPQGTTEIRIDYVGLSLTMAEKVHYRYRLEGVDKGWQDAQGRRQAFYTNLTPGSHRFHVVAANNDGVWNETGASVSFVIPPTFIQTRWFLALCVLGATTMIALLIRFRFRQLAGRMRMRYEERIVERERIARELHDTLLQGTHGLVLSVQAAATSVPAQEPARAMLERALEVADRVLIEVRDRIQDLRIPADIGIDLAGSLTAVGHELARGSSICFRAVVEGRQRDLNPDAIHEGYHVAREALLNAFRHAHAASIEVHLVYGDDALGVQVRDDGTGIKTTDEARRPRHWGLRGMRERAQNIGAQLDIGIRDSGGTEVTLRIPGSIAYKTESAHSGWLFFGRHSQK